MADQPPPATGPPTPGLPSLAQHARFHLVRAIRLAGFGAQVLVALPEAAMTAIRDAWRASFPETAQADPPSTPPASGAGSLRTSVNIVGDPASGVFDVTGAELRPSVWVAPERPSASTTDAKGTSDPPVSS